MIEVLAVSAGNQSGKKVRKHNELKALAETESVTWR